MAGVELACLEDLVYEANVHLPRRGRIWVVASRDEYGQPVWRTTGLSDRKQAQAMARRVGGGGQKEADSPGRSVQEADDQGSDPVTQKEVAVVMKISERAVRNIEQRPFKS